MRAAEASQFSKNFDDDDALLKPQWLQRPSGAGIANQFRSADQFRGGRGGRKFADDRRPRRMGEGLSHKTSSPTLSSDFPPLAPFYRSHSTGSLTPADIPSASSRVLTPPHRSSGASCFRSRGTFILHHHTDVLSFHTFSSSRQARKKKPSASTENVTFPPWPRLHRLSINQRVCAKANQPRLFLRPSAHRPTCF
jgi:hypothetical protein